METIKDYHSIHVLDDPSINGNSSNSNNGSSKNPNNNSNSGTGSNTGSNSTNNSSNNGSGTPNIPTNTIQSVLKNKNNKVPDILIDYSQLAKGKKIHHIEFRDDINSYDFTLNEANITRFNQ